MSLQDFWRLDEQKRLVRCSPAEWRTWFGEIENRRVAETEICGFRVSTVFLGIDLEPYRDHPVLWETMVFGEGTGWMDWDTMRCGGSIEQAEEQHECMCRAVREVHGITMDEDVLKDG